LNHEKLTDIQLRRLRIIRSRIFCPRECRRAGRETLIEAVRAGLAVPAGQHPEIIRQKFERPSEAERPPLRRTRQMPRMPMHTSWALTPRSLPANPRSAISRAIGTVTAGIDELAAGIVEMILQRRHQ